MSQKSLAIVRMYRGHAGKHPALHAKFKLTELKICTTTTACYNTRGHGERFLYEILKERLTLENVNISHTIMPTWEEHQEFIHRYCSGDKTHPYKKWYIIKLFKTMVGHCYLTQQNEIGVFVAKKFWGQGIGPSAIKALMLREPEAFYIANINPENERSKKIFENLGFKLIQHTYKISLKEAMPIMSSQVEWKMLPDRPNTVQ
jgi:GNAT superfamily N-acetyltransferase